MINKLFKVMLLCSVLTLWWGCSSDSDNDDSSVLAEKPNWQLNLVANDAAPDWAVDDIEEYEMTMSMGVRLNTLLAQYASSDDLLAAFINDECRGVSTPSIFTSGESVLVSAGLNIVGNSGENGVTLKYYCKRLNRIFTLNNWINFNPNQSPSLNGSAYVLPFETEAGMVATQVTILLPKDADVAFGAGDEIALLSDGNQCRSSVAVVGNQQVTLNVLAPQNSHLTVDWYSASKRTIYEAAETISLNNSDSQTISVTTFKIKK